MGKSLMGDGMMEGEAKSEMKPKKGVFEVRVLDKGFSMSAMHETEKKGELYPMMDRKEGVASSVEEVRECFEKFMRGEEPFSKA